MGNNSSSAKSNNEIVNKVITQTTMSNIAECSGTATQTQNLKVSDIVAIGCNLKLGGKQEAELKYNFSCVQDNANTLKLQQEFTNNLKSAVEAASRSIANLGDNKSNSENNNKIVNEIVTQTDFKNYATCVSKSFQEQNQEVRGLTFVCNDPNQVIDLSNISQKVIGDVAQDCFQKNNNASDIVQKLHNDLTAETTARSEGLALPDIEKMSRDLMKMLKELAPIAIVLIAAICGVCLLSSAAPIIMKMTAGGKTGSNAGGSSGMDYGSSGMDSSGMQMA